MEKEKQEYFIQRDDSTVREFERDTVTDNCCLRAFVSNSEQVRVLFYFFRRRPT